MNIKRRQSGFTLIEIVVTLGIVALILAIVSPMLGRLLDFKSNIETETNLQIIGASVEEWYEENAWVIDENANATILLPNGGAITNGSNTLSNEGWKQLAMRYTSSANNIYDGYNHAYQVFVSNRIEQFYEGVLIPYHVVAIVSGNGKGVTPEGVSVVESTFNINTGELNLADRENAHIISGFEIQKNKFDNSRSKLKNVAKAYQDYYWSRYAAQGGEPAINYFARYGSNTRWDMTATVNALCGSSADILPNGRRALGHNIHDSGLVDELQLPSSAVQSEWGRDFRLLNCGSTNNVQVNGVSKTFSARTPQSAGGRNIPPYTAILGFSLPNSETFSTTITSQF